jgi:hypothetical protein
MCIYWSGLCIYGLIFTSNLSSICNHLVRYSFFSTANWRSSLTSFWRSRTGSRIQNKLLIVGMKHDKSQGLNLRNIKTILLVLPHEESCCAHPLHHDLTAWKDALEELKGEATDSISMGNHNFGDNSWHSLFQNGLKTYLSFPINQLMPEPMPRYKLKE